MTKKSQLHVVSAGNQSADQPTRPLGQHGQTLWNNVMRDYDVSDVGGRELLLLACEATDRASSLREKINRDGEFLQLRNGALKPHPGLKMELASQAFVAKTLRVLGLNVEPARPGPGRPPGPLGWDPYDGGH